jgi:hypothetical protein
MKQLLITSVLFLILTSCSGRKQIENAISNGNYDNAIEHALQKLSKNKDKKHKQDYILMLQDAYSKVLEKDLRDIDHLKKDGNPEQYQHIYEIYLALEARQNAIKHIMPLQINGKNLYLKFGDYSSELIDYRYKTSNYLMNKGVVLLNSNDKYKAREAFDLFRYIDTINPNFKDTQSLIIEAQKKGTDYIVVSIENKTDQIIPKPVAEDLLRFNTYGLNQFWTVYHAAYAADTNYDFEMQIQLKHIEISPEQINSQQKLKQKEITDGWEYDRDTNGAILIDSLGNKIKINKIINVRARYFEVNQYKYAQMTADVVYKDLQRNQTLDIFTINSEFVFEHFYSRIRGDKRALNKQELKLIKNVSAEFPSNAQMVQHTGEAIKLKLKHIMRSYNIRKG